MSLNTLENLAFVEALRAVAGYPSRVPLTERVSLTRQAEESPLVHYFSVARDFTDTPGGRHRSDHSKPGYSGEELRALLVPLLRDCQAGPNGEDPLKLAVVVDLDGTAGFAGSFLAEAFANLLTLEGFSYSFLLEHLILADTQGLTNGVPGRGYRQEILADLSEAEQIQHEAVVVFQGPFGRGHKPAYLTIAVGGSDMELASDEALASQGIMRVFEGTRAESKAWRAANPIVNG